MSVSLPRTVRARIQALVRSTQELESYTAEWAAYQAQGRGGHHDSARDEHRLDLVAVVDDDWDALEVSIAEAIKAAKDGARRR
jgi:hypothetical protein